MKILVKICIISLALSGASLTYADSKIEYHLALKSAQKAFNRLKSDSEERLASQNLLSQARAAAKIGEFAEALKLTEKAEFYSNLSLWICE